MKVIVFFDKDNDVRSICTGVDMEYPSDVNVLHISTHSAIEPEWHREQLRLDVSFEISAWYRGGGSVRVYNSVEEAAEATEHPISSYILRLI